MIYLSKIKTDRTLTKCLTDWGSSI